MAPALNLESYPDCESGCVPLPAVTFGEFYVITRGLAELLERVTELDTFDEMQIAAGRIMPLLERLGRARKAAPDYGSPTAKHPADWLGIPTEKPGL